MKTYHVYTLINPLNDKIYYVGVTTQPKRRRRMHVCGYDTSSANQTNQEILANGCEPIFEIIDRVNAIDKFYGLQLEGYYRQLYWSSDVDLVNERQTGPRWMKHATPSQDYLLAGIEAVKRFARSPIEKYEEFSHRRAIEELDLGARYG